MVVNARKVRDFAIERQVARSRVESTAAPADATMLRSLGRLPAEHEVQQRIGPTVTADFPHDLDTQP